LGLFRRLGFAAIVLTPVVLASIVTRSLALPPVDGFSSILVLPAIVPLPTVVLRHTPRLLCTLQVGGRYLG
jgi:hypothetical protein